MNATLRGPDELAQRHAAEDGDRKCHALKNRALAESWADRFTAFRLSQLLAIPTRCEMDGFPKAHGIFKEQMLEALAQARQTPERLGR